MVHDQAYINIELAKTIEIIWHKFPSSFQENESDWVDLPSVGKHG